MEIDTNDDQSNASFPVEPRVDEDVDVKMLTQSYYKLTISTTVRLLSP